MARYRMRIRTDWPADEAFAYLADLSNFAERDPGVASSVQVAGDGPGVGAEYYVEASGSVLRYIVDEHESPNRIRAHARNRWLTSVDTISVSSDGPGSVVSYDASTEVFSVSGGAPNANGTGGRVRAVLTPREGTAAAAEAAAQTANPPITPATPSGTLPGSKR